MKAIIAKEMRELLKWAALVLALLGIGTYIIIEPSLIAASGMRETLIYWTTHCAAVTTVGAAVAGLLLGIVSTVFEARADRYAFLVHRPLPRTAIFLGKAAAGLALLLVAVGIPFAASIVWCETADFWAAPFRFGLAVPWMIDILAGGVYFFAGMTIGLRRARWYGSKVFPLGFPLLATGLLWAVPQLWQAVLVLLAALAVSGAAAWGTFLAGGESRPQPKVARAALVAHVFSGACLLAVPAFCALFALADMTLPRRQFPAFTYTEPVFLQDGSAMLATHHPGGPATLTDLQGNVVGTYSDYDELHKAIPREQELYLSSVRWFWSSIPFYFRGYRDPGRIYRIVASTGLKTGFEIWCFSMREGLLRGYDLEKKRPIGYLGPSGFSPPDASPPSPFPGRPCRGDFGLSQPFAFSGGVFRVDFTERKVLAIFTPAAGERVLGTAELHGPPLGVGQNSFTLPPAGTAVLTEASIEAVELQTGNSISVRPLPFDPDAVLALSVGLASSTRRIVVRVNGTEASSDQVFMFDPDGKLATRFEVPQFRSSADWPVMRSEIAVAVLGGPAWFVGSGAAVWWMREWMVYARFGKVWPFLLVPCILCALVALFLARRESMRPARAAAWIASAFFLGLPGLLTLLSLDRRATLVRCPACSARRPVERELCPRCAAPFPAPAKDGTEILV